MADKMQIRMTKIGAPFALILWVTILFYPLLGSMEGKLFPVVIDAHVTRYEPDGHGGTHIWGTFDKVRDCAFIRLEWYLGDPETGTIVGLSFDEGERDRDVGDDETFGPWTIYVRHEQFPDTTAVAVHRCHPFWLTRTTFRTPLQR